MKLRKNGKMQKLSGTRSSVQSPFHKQTFVIAVKTYAKADIKRFLLLSNFVWYLYFVSNVLTGIAVSLQKNLFQSVVISSTFSNEENLQSHY